MSHDPAGPVFEIQEPGDKLDLRINEIRVTTLEGVIERDATKHLELTAMDMTVMYAEQDYNCSIENPIYAELKEQLDASYYIARKNQVYFSYYEEYRDGDLTYTVYDPLHTPVTSGLLLENQNTSTSTGSDKEYGSNKFLLDLTSANLTQEAYYILEVQNDKNETWKLRFRPTLN